MTGAPTAVLERIEQYYDDVPRAFATAENLGPFTLFVRRDPHGWPYYARPRLGHDGTVTADDVRRVRDRQRELGLPESFEWVAETSPGVADPARAAGLQVNAHPLLVLRHPTDPGAVPAAVRIEVLQAASAQLGRVASAINAGFEDSDEVEEARDNDSYREALARGLMRTVGAFDAGGAVGGGSHSPRGRVTELAGIAVLPRARGRGIGAAVTARLVADARALGVETVFLSAGTDRVARIYERVGFERVGTACIAEPSAPGSA